MTDRVFEILTHVPGTFPWRAYRETRAWLLRAEGMLLAEFPEMEPFPRPLPRRPRAMKFAVKAMLVPATAMLVLERGGTAESAIDEMRTAYFDLMGEETPCL